MSGSPATLVSPVVQPSAALAEGFARVRSTTEELAASLGAEDQMVQSMPEASPAKWHQAHTTWFFETFILIPHASNYRPFDERFTFLFNSYYKQLEGHPNRAMRGLFSRPTLTDVQGYRRHVNQAMGEFLARERELPAGVTQLIELGLNHEQQHQELMVTDIKHAFWMNPLRPAYKQAGSRPPGGVPPQTWSAFSEGIYEVGYEGAGFAFDNESPRHKVYLRAFQIASRLVTNREYLEFMNDGGYRRAELWLSDGWDHVCVNALQAPLYWEQQGSSASVFTCGGVQPVELNEPVCHVSYYEADAYARWAGARLPTEHEWEIAATGKEVSGNLLDQGRFHPAQASSGSGLQQMFGDVWEWTASPYAPYPSYQPAHGALGEYNGKFMCNQMVLRGGSCATPASHIRATYRNFFPPNARWQFMGIRLAK